MKIGICTGIENAESAKKYGYDYLEISFQNLASVSDEEMKPYFETVRGGMPIEAANLFFRGGTDIYSDKYDPLSVASYIKRGMYHASQLGIRTVVLGSGGVRRIPADYDRAFCYDRFVSVLRTGAEIADEYGILLCVEPLNQRETNLINGVKDGYLAAKDTGCKNAGTILDFYHHFIENEPISVISECKDRLFHLHIARPDPDRDAPYEGDIPAIREWAKALKENGIDSRISLECNPKPNFEEAVKRAKPILDLFGK